MFTCFFLRPRRTPRLSWTDVGACRCVEISDSKATTSNMRTGIQRTMVVRWSHGHCSSLKPWRQRRSTPQSARNAESFGSSSIARSRQQPSLRRNADTVNAHGAMILLSSKVSIGQLLTLRNSRTGEEVLCRVAYLSPYQSEKREVGVDFRKPCPRFSRISFPPPDWTTQSPGAKSSPTRPSSTPGKSKIKK